MLAAIKCLVASVLRLRELGRLGVQRSGAIREGSRPT